MSAHGEALGVVVVLVVVVGAGVVVVDVVVPVPSHGVPTDWFFVNRLHGIWYTANGSPRHVHGLTHGCVSTHDSVSSPTHALQSHAHTHWLLQSADGVVVVLVVVVGPGSHGKRYLVPTAFGKHENGIALSGGQLQPCGQGNVRIHFDVMTCGQNTPGGPQGESLHVYSQAPPQGDGVVVVVVVVVNWTQDPSAVSHGPVGFRFGALHPQPGHGRRMMSQSPPSDVPHRHWPVQVPGDGVVVVVVLPHGSQPGMSGGVWPPWR